MLVLIFILLLIVFFAPLVIGILAIGVMAIAGIWKWLLIPVVLGAVAGIIQHKAQG